MSKKDRSKNGQIGFKEMREGHSWRIKTQRCLRKGPTSRGHVARENDVIRRGYVRDRGEVGEKLIVRG